MMISLESYINELKSKDYVELVKEKDRLIDEINCFEHERFPKDRYYIDPSPDVLYQMNLEYFGKLCNYMQERFNFEYEFGGKEWEPIV